MSRDTYQERLDDFRCGLDGERHGGNGETRPDTADGLITDQMDKDLSDFGRLDGGQNVEQDLTGSTHTDRQAYRDTYSERDMQACTQTNTSTRQKPLRACVSLRSLDKQLPFELNLI